MNYQVDGAISIGKNKKVVGLMTNEFVGKIKTKLVGLKPKIYSYLTDDSSTNKKANDTKVHNKART